MNPHLIPFAGRVLEEIQYNLMDGNSYVTNPGHFVEFKPLSDAKPDFPTYLAIHRDSICKLLATPCEQSGTRDFRGNSLLDFYLCGCNNNPKIDSPEINFYIPKAVVGDDFSEDNYALDIFVYFKSLRNTEIFVTKHHEHSSKKFDWALISKESLRRAKEKGPIPLTEPTEF